MSRLLWAVAALLLLYTLGGFLLAPWLIQRYVPSYAEEHLGQRATIGAVRVNPFLLTLEASAFRLEGKGEHATLAFERLFGDFELSSIVEGAWTFSDLRLTGGSVGLEIDRDGRFNLAELMARLRKPDAPESERAALILERVVIEGARVSLVDLSGERRASAILDPVEIEISGLSTLPGRRGRYALSARAQDGGALTAKGEITLEPVAVQGELALRAMKLAGVWQFFRDAFHVAEPEGELSVSGRYAYGGTHAGALVVSEVGAQVSGLALASRADGAPLVALRMIRLGGGRLTLPERAVSVDTLQVSEGAIEANIGDDGSVDWQQLVKTDSAASVSGEARARAAVQPWQVHLKKAAMDGVALKYTDRSGAAALEVHAGALDAELELRVTAGAGPTRFLAENLRATLNDARVAAASSDAPPATLASLRLNGGRIDSAERLASASLVEMSGASVELARDQAGAAGLLQALLPASPHSNETAPAGEPWRVALHAVGFEKFALAWRDSSLSPALTASAREMKGRFKLEASAGAGPAQVIAQEIELTVDGARVTTPSADAPLAALGSFALAGGRIDTGARSLAARTIALSGGAMDFVRGRDGPGGLLRVLVPAGRAGADPGAQNAAASSAWTYRVGSIALERFDAALADRTFEPAIAYNVRVASAVLENIDSASTTPIAFKAALRVGAEGTLTGRGTLAQDFGRARAEVKAAGIALQPLQPLVSRHAALTLQSGTFSAAATVTYDPRNGPALTARGMASIAGFHLDEAASGERFLAWKTLVADDIRLDVSPDALAIAELRVLEPGMKLVIAEDRSINLTGVLRTDGGAARDDAAPAPLHTASAPAIDSTDGAAPYPFRIERIRLEHGTLDFADLSLVLPFATRVHELAGSIVNASSAPDVRARIELEGRVAEYGEAHAEGSLILRRPTEFLDIVARFDNVQMPALSPYTATFAGRKIATGKLWLTLEYKIVNTQLAGENRIVLDDFVLGERVEAPNALDLPLDLAVALLKDTEGKISLAVPVTGDIDHPQFDYGKVIRTAIGNAIGRVVTAPFRMLAALFGKGEKEELQRIAFEPGSARIAPPQREKLDHLAQALQARPQLKLVVRGPYDAERDAQRLRRERVRQQLDAQLGMKLEPGARPGPIAFASADTQKALETLLESAQPNGIAALESRFAEREGRRPDRLNPVLGAFGRGSKDVEFYEAVYERLVELYPLPETAVRVLAAERAQAVVESLTRAGMRRERLQAGGITPVEADGNGSIETEFALEALSDAS